MNDLNGWHPLTLPSLGRFYGDKIPGGDIEITPWTTVQEEMMVRYSSHAAQDRLKMIQELVQGNARFPEGFDYGELLVADQHFLLMRLRAISLMPQYTIDFSCSKCSKTSELSFDLDSLEVRTPEDDDAEPFTQKLPRCGCTVSVRLMRTKDEAAVAKYRKELEEANLPNVEERIYRYSLARQLEKVNGEDLKFDEKTDFLGNLILVDLQVYKSIFEQNDIGLNMEARVECPSCRFCPSNWSIPLQLCFFHPKQCDIRSVCS